MLIWTSPCYASTRHPQLKKTASLRRGVEGLSTHHLNDGRFKGMTFRGPSFERQQYRVTVMPVDACFYLDGGGCRQRVRYVETNGDYAYAPRGAGCKFRLDGFAFKDQLRVIRELIGTGMGHGESIKRLNLIRPEAGTERRDLFSPVGGAFQCYERTIGVQRHKISLGAHQLKEQAGALRCTVKRPVASGWPSGWTTRVCSLPARSDGSCALI